MISDPIDTAGSVSPQAFDYILSKIKDGFLFEQFAQDLLCQILGVDFIPLGGVHDRAIDGLEHCAHPKVDEKTIYQISIEQNPRQKLLKTLQALKENNIKCLRLFYVTNKPVDQQDLLEEELYDRHGVVVRCRDAAWLRGNLNKNEGTIRTYLTFIESNYHEFADPGKTQIVADFVTDPRIFVFLRQQWERYGNRMRLDDLLTDSLILYSLEGTDPDEGKFRDRAAILKKFEGLVCYEPKILEARLDARLKHLSTKPRRIKFYEEGNKYCLPYSTRLELRERNIEDASLHEQFVLTANERLKKHLETQAVQIKDALNLLEGTFNAIFKQQGLEFADFVIKAENRDAVEKSLADIIADVVDSSAVTPANRTRVKAALLGAIREIIYRGNDSEHEYLRRLAHSYLMLFLLQCDPKICAFFSTMAGKLKVFVCTSLLVPALSEYPLPPEHRRHWNLLVSANKAGVQLLVNKAILQELVSHLQLAKNRYNEEYHGMETVFSDEIAVRYVKEIILRSYFYSLGAGQKWTIEQFLDNFVTPSATSEEMEIEMVEWLRHNFGVTYVEDAALGVTVNQHDLDTLTKELSGHKRSKRQASADARTILTVYALREKNQESGSSGIFGFRTWWLSKDTLTHQAVMKCFGKRYPTSCYIRPDFLLNYVSLAPSYDDANRVFDRMFPTLMGVTLSHHIPDEVSDIIHQAIKQHANKDLGRVKASLRTLSDQLKTDQKTINRIELKHYLDEQLGSA
jgi:hypothetical protein